MDAQVIELFKKWQVKKNKYSDLDIGKVEFDSLKIGELISFMKKGKTPKYTKNGETSDCIVIKSGQARGNNNNFDFTKTAYLQVDKIDLDDERNLKRGDILINTTGVGTAGRVTRFDREGCFVVDSHIMILRFDDKIYDPKYILSFFKSFGF